MNEQENISSSFLPSAAVQNITQQHESELEALVGRGGAEERGWSSRNRSFSQKHGITANESRVESSHHRPSSARNFTSKLEDGGGGMGGQFESGRTRSGVAVVADKTSEVQVKRKNLESILSIGRKELIDG